MNKIVPVWLRRSGWITLLAAALVFLIAGFDNRLKTSHYTVTSSKIPQAFDGCVLVQVSDLHDSVLGPMQQQLVQAILSCKPDVIVFTGDMINRDDPQPQATRQLLQGIAGHAPIFAVAGNHELDNPAAQQSLDEIYREFGVVTLDGGLGMALPLPGADPARPVMLYGQKMETNGRGDHWMNFNLRPQSPEPYNILLTHYSNLFDEIAPAGFDLVFAGHTHGGIIRLPFVGGVLSNSGTLFPEYDGGLFHAKAGESVLISSRGLGNSTAIPRFYNRRDLVCVTLRRAEAPAQ